MTMIVGILAKDRGQRHGLEAVLMGAGLAVTAFTDPAICAKALAEGPFDLLVAAETVVIAAVRAREATRDMPILILATDPADSAQVILLKAGADEVVSCQTPTPILLARISALMRRTAGWRRLEPSAMDSVALDQSRSAVIIDGEDQTLTATEFRLASLLIRNTHRPLSRAYLMEEVWGAAINRQSRTLDAHLCRLRSKLRLTADRGFTFAAVYGHGYRLTRARPLAIRGAS